MNIVTVNGTRLLVTGGSDGAALAMKPQTGEPVWNLVIAKRGLNTGIVVNGKYAIVSHGDENLDSNEMGMIAAFDATAQREARQGKHQVVGPGIRGRFLLAGASMEIASTRPITAAILFAFDVETGHQLWKQNLGTVQKASAVFGDGKIYIGSRERQVLHPAPARRPLRSLERSGVAAQRSRA